MNMSVETDLLMSTIDDLKNILADVLQLGDKVASYDANTQLLGSIPELDSMAVVGVITAIEDTFGIVVDDDEIDAETFETLGSLAEFVDSKL